MPHTETLQKKFELLRICVIIPTYNNAQTIASVINDVLVYSNNIIVVNDGSTDHTESILHGFPAIEKISYPKNKGKGWAIRQGFKKAIDSGFDYAITIDSDGQHFAKDLSLFVEKLEKDGAAILLGSRNLAQKNMPGKNSFGNKFSNFWFTIETGLSLPDTQTGYRLYPLQLIKDMSFYTRKYEFEIEVLVRSSWRSIKLTAIPVSVYYAPKEERITHFRPFKDFFRISVLNTVLVLIAFLYIKPRDFIRSLFQKNWKETLKDHLLNPEQADSVKAFSVGFGVFMGIVPLWGFQLLLAIALSIILKLNKALVIVAANISVPPMIPLIIFLSYKVGTLWLPNTAVTIPFSSKITLDSIRINLLQYIYGSITLAIIAGFLFGAITFVLLKFFKRKTSPAA